MTWRCRGCGYGKWVGWRAGPAHEGWDRRAQCVRCGRVQDLPPGEQAPAEPVPSLSAPASLPEWLAIPGLPEALREVGALFELVQNMGEIAPTVEQIVTTAMAASRPHVQAELLADLADEFADLGGPFLRFGAMLDQMSHDMRERITR